MAMNTDASTFQAPTGRSDTSVARRATSPNPTTFQGLKGRPDTGVARRAASLACAWGRAVCIYGALLFCVITVYGQADLASTEDPPNILFIFSDDHANNAIGAYGSVINQTPNLDRLAKEGAIFLNSYCANSICQPSRASILTGKHSHRNGVLGNGSRWDARQVVFPRLCAELFDLQEDPDELKSVYGEAEYAFVREGMLGELARLRVFYGVPEKVFEAPFPRNKQANRNRKR